MKKSIFLSLVLGICMMAQAKVAFLVPAGNTDINSLPFEEYTTNDDGIFRQHEQSPERRAWIWFNEAYVAFGLGQFICFDDLNNIPSDIHAIWIYVDRVNFNAEAFDEDGFFHTGDAGYLKDGELFLTERIKDLFKTSNGKYVAPQQVEALLLVDKFIDQVAVVADQRKFVSALVVPEFRMVEEWARDNNIKFSGREELCANEKVKKMLMERINTLQQGLAHYEQIKRFTLLPHHFSMESGELTNTLKLKRPVVYRNYKDIIEKMYEE